MSIKHKIDYFKIINNRDSEGKTTSTRKSGHTLTGGKYCSRKEKKTNLGTVNTRLVSPGVFGSILSHQNTKHGSTKLA